MAPLIAAHTTHDTTVTDKIGDKNTFYDDYSSMSGHSIPCSNLDIILLLLIVVIDILGNDWVNQPSFGSLLLCLGGLRLFHVLINEV